MSIRIKILTFSLVITVITISLCFSVFSTNEPIPESSVYISNDKKYILKEYNGMLAIYENDKNTPIEVLDVNISSLPERDIERIKQGIVADSLSEIYSFAEDYE